MTTLTPDAKARARFWSKVEKTESCWNWMAGKYGTGYGHFSHRSKKAYAHRVSFEFAYGPIPTDTTVDHTCRNRACVNPGHLRSVTPKQNAENRHFKSAVSKSGVRGVFPSQTAGKWATVVRHFGKNHYAGTYSSITEAEAAVTAKRNELFTHNNADRMAV